MKKSHKFLAVLLVLFVAFKLYTSFFSSSPLNIPKEISINLPDAGKGVSDAISSKKGTSDLIIDASGKTAGLNNPAKIFRQYIPSDDKLPMLAVMNNFNISPERYNFSMLYVILYDDKTDPRQIKSQWNERMRLVQDVFYRESLGKIDLNVKIVFLHTKKLGSKTLNYEKNNVYSWLELIDDYMSKTRKYDILIFTPIREIEWCLDSHSIGYNIQDKIMICQEYYSPILKQSNKKAAGLIIHKILHGMGYNHISQDFKQISLLDWYMGLPQTNGFPHSSFSQFKGLFFDEHIYKVLGIIPRTEFEENCLDAEGLGCASANNHFCDNAWDSYCIDSDKDDILDKEDEYVFSSPRKGNDSDKDGIVDALDLCSYNEINIKGSDWQKMKLILSGINSLEFNPSKDLKITKIVKTPHNIINGFVVFQESQSVSKKGSKISFSSQEMANGFLRLELHYTFNGEEFYRPYYVYSSARIAERHFSNNEYLFEREWYYFNRFGCDIPSDTKFSDLKTYDKDKNGLPDRLPLAVEIPKTYDWDEDGFSDYEDSLPTVHGKCSNSILTGVKDSDGDGLCDPGSLRFERNFENEYDLLMGIDREENSDNCPYLYGLKKNNGCPVLEDGSSWYST